VDVNKSLPQFLKKPKSGAMNRKRCPLLDEKHEEADVAYLFMR
jgi:hypothetical protein